MKLLRRIATCTEKVIDDLAKKLGLWSPICMTFAGIAACLGYWGFVKGDNSMTVNGVLPTLAGMICSVAVFLLGFTVLSAVLMMTAYLLSRDSVYTWVHLQLNKLSKRVQSRNIACIYPFVREFLFEVLSLHENTLHLPLGLDASCLTPRGEATAFRKNCLFFRFELILPEAPAMDTDTLRSILQQYIWSELATHGISGLAANFDSVPTIYVDRMRYCEKTHILQFSVLYISTPDMKNYALRAEQNRKASITPEREVYDDEV